MLLSEAIIPISYLKTHASELINKITGNGETMIITQNGKAKVVLQDIKEYEKTRETLAMLKILALGKKEIEEGKAEPIDQAFADLGKQIDEGNLK